MFLFLCVLISIQTILSFICFHNTTENAGPLSLTTFKNIPPHSQNKMEASWCNLKLWYSQKLWCCMKFWCCFGVSGTLGHLLFNLISSPTSVLLNTLANFIRGESQCSANMPGKHNHRRDVKVFKRGADHLPLLGHSRDVAPPPSVK